MMITRAGKRRRLGGWMPVPQTGWATMIGRQPTQAGGPIRQVTPAISVRSSWETPDFPSPEAASTAGSHVSGTVENRRLSVTSVDTFVHGGQENRRTDRVLANAGLIEQVHRYSLGVSISKDLTHTCTSRTIKPQNMAS